MTEPAPPANELPVAGSAPVGRPPGLFTAFFVGLHRALAAPRVVLLLWLSTLLVSVLIALPAWPYLSTLLSERPAAWQLARGQSDILWVEIVPIDGPYLSMLMLMVGFGVVVSTLSRLLLSGGILPSLLPEGHPLRPRRGELLARAASAFGAMARLELLGFVFLRLPIFGGLVAIGLALWRSPLVLEQSFTSLAVKILLPLGIGIWLWMTSGVVLTYAALYRLAQPETAVSTMRAFHDGLKLGLGPALGRSLGLGLVGVLLMLLVVAGGRWAAMQLDYGLLVATAFLIRQAAALLRTLVSLSVAGGAAELWRRSSE